MRIAIITLPLRGNYGGILQNYALQKKLKSLGHSVETIRLPMDLKQPFWKRPLVYGYRCFKRYLLHKECRIYYERWHNSIHPVLIKHMQEFVDKYIEYRMIKKLSEIKEDDYDAIIVGSDQVWRPAFTLKPITKAYLSFAKDWKYIKRISYAASFGTDEWEYTEAQTVSCASLLKLFCGISVRERDGVTMCRQYLNCNAIQVLDPTMLLDKTDYIRLLQNKKLNTKPRGQLLTYILDDTSDKRDVVNMISKDLGYKIYHANSRYEDRTAPLEERIQPSVEQWLKDFYDAKLVITDSFHATVFSILFGKPFLVLGNHQRGLSRIYSLLQMFGLEQHLVVSKDKICGQDFSFDTRRVYELLQKYREVSNSFLKRSLLQD